MIEFKGEMSEECQRYMIMKNSKAGWIAGSMAAILFSIPTIFIGIYVDTIYLLFLPLFVAVAVLAGCPPLKKDRAVIIPSRITIAEDGTMHSQSDKFDWERDVCEVNEVLDFGKWYFIKFNYISRNSCFVCEKALLCQGSLEEFEKIFEGKVTRCYDA